MRRIRKTNEYLVHYISPNAAGRSIFESSVLLNSRIGISEVEKNIERTNNLKMVGVTSIQLLRSKRR